MVIIYVDNLHGDDSGEGTFDNPVYSLTKAISIAPSGTYIIIRTGSGLTYGPAIINKNVSFKNAAGASPIVGDITINNAQCSIEGLTFNSGIVVNNANVGGVTIKNCTFNSSTIAIEINGTDYISITRNIFNDYEYGIKINQAKEVIIASNIFNLGQRAIDVNTVERLDVWRNTIYGGGSTSSAGASGEDLRIIYTTLSSINILYKRVQLPGYATELIGESSKYNVAVNAVHGSSFEYDIDFTVTNGGSLISWDGYQLDGVLQVGDVIRIMYAEGSSPVGDVEAIKLLNVIDPNSTIDSNNITGTPLSDIVLGIYFDSPVRIRNNNFFKTNIHYSGSIPSNYVTGIITDPSYIDPVSGDFRLQATSPDINAGDQTRWKAILDQMGIGVTGGGYTGIAVPSRTNVADFDRDIDEDKVHRLYAGLTGDIGAYAYYTKGVTGPEYYVSEEGYDVFTIGETGAPFGSFGYGFLAATGGQGLIVKVNSVVPSKPLGYKYSRFVESDNLNINNSTLTVGSSRDKDIVFIYPQYPDYSTGSFVSIDGSDSWTGTQGAPFRTINQAINAGIGNDIIIEPGIYPAFTGMDGKRLIGIQGMNYINYNNYSINDFSIAPWTGIQGSVILASDSLEIGSGDSSVTSNFSFDNKIDFKVMVNIDSSTFYVTLFNSDNSISIIRDTIISPKIIVRYMTNSATYSICYNFYDDNVDVKIRITIEDGTVNVYVTGPATSIHRTFTLYDNFNNGWLVNFNTTSCTDVSVKNLYIIADSVTGTTPVTQSIVSKKVFGIKGNFIL